MKDLWAEKDSNLRTRERTDLQSVAFSHSAICPFFIIDNWKQSIAIKPSHLSESNQRPTDYKSVALPAELKWHIHLHFIPLRFVTNDLPDPYRDALPTELKWHLIMPAFAQSYGGRSNKELPPILRGGKGKGIWYLEKSLERIFVLIMRKKKVPSLTRP